MMGSAEELPQAPSERPKFIEDMSEAEAAAAVSGVCVCVCWEGVGEFGASLTAIYTHIHTCHNCSYLCQLVWRTLATHVT